MVSIGLYSKQLTFFLFLALILSGLIWVIHNQSGQASGRPLDVPLSASEVAVELELLDSGRVIINQQTVPGVVHFGLNQDEFSYLLLDQPGASLDSLTATLHLPRPVNPNELVASTIIIHNLSQIASVRLINPQTIEYQLADIGPAATVTLVAKLPKGTVKPSLAQRFFGSIQTLPQVIWLSFALVGPLTTILLLLILVRSQLRYRPANQIAAVRPSPPHPLSPAVVAALVDGRVSARAIAATLLDLARREYLEVASHDRTFTFTKRRRLLEANDATDLLPFEAALLGKIFAADAPQASEGDISVRIGANLFSKKVAEIYLAIYELVTKAGYFVENPSTVHGSYRLVGLAFFFLGLLGLGLGALFFNDPPTPLLFWVGMILSSLVLVAMAPRMPAQTAQGLEEREEWLKFRNYLASTAPTSFAAQNQEEFFRFLPYAVALGVEAEWSERFARAPFRLPDWFAADRDLPYLTDFTAEIFPLVGFLARELAALREPTLS